MKYWTYAEIRTKLQQDLAIADELFVEPDELKGYVNEAIDEAEAEIHELFEDYFLSRTKVTLVAGQEGYDQPSNIYGDKIRKVFYRNASRGHRVEQIPDDKKLEVYETYQLSTSSSAESVYSFFLENSVAGAPQMILVPTPQESGAFVTVWYLRNANRLSLDTDKCDIPEFVSFVIQYVKVRVYEKEGHENLVMAIQTLEQQRAQMSATLKNRTLTERTEIEADMGFYKDHI